MSEPNSNSYVRSLWESMLVDQLASAESRLLRITGDRPEISDADRRRFRQWDRAERFFGVTRYHDEDWDDYAEPVDLASALANDAAARLRRARLFYDAADDFTSAKAECWYGPEWGYVYTQALYETLFGRRGLGPKGNPDPFNPPQWRARERGVA